MRYDPDQKQRTRDKLLKEAAKAIRRDGPQDFSLSAVMAGAGLTNGGFYAHFKSRDDLLAAGIQQMFAESRAGAQLASGTPREGLAGFIDFYLSAAHRDARTYGCPLPVLSSEAGRLPTQANRHFAKGVARLTSMIGEQLAKLGVPDADAEAASLLSELVGALTLARADPDRDSSSLILERSRRAIARRFDLDLSPKPASPTRKEPSQ